jgi:hypothetical protein
MVYLYRGRMFSCNVCEHPVHSTNYAFSMLHMLLGLTDPYMLVLCTRVNMKKTRFKIIPNYNFMTTATRLRSVATNCPNI